VDLVTVELLGVAQVKEIEAGQHVVRNKQQ
jgi:hypothetical protein